MSNLLTVPYNWQKSLALVIGRFQNGKQEFSKVKDTTSEIITPRL